MSEIVSAQQRPLSIASSVERPHDAFDHVFQVDNTGSAAADNHRKILMQRYKMPGRDEAVVSWSEDPLPD